MVGRFGHHGWRRQLEGETGLAMPSFASGGPVYNLLFLTSFGLPLASYAYHGGFGALMALPISLALLTLLRFLGRFPARLRTVGDLARGVAALNVAALASPNEPLRRPEIWTALQGVIRHRLDWNGTVMPTTRFFREK